MNPPLFTLRLLGRLLLSAGSDFVFAGMFLLTWYAPNALGEGTLSGLMFVMILEFLAVLATGFMAGIGSRDDTPRNRLFLYTIIGLLCILMAAGFAAAFGTVWAFVAFIWLIGSKFPNVVLRPPDFDAQFILMANWAAMVVLYLSGTFLSVGVEWPALGITPEVIAAQGFDTGGEWLEEPYRVMVFGAYYYTGLGLLSIVNEVIPLIAAKRRRKA